MHLDQRSEAQTQPGGISLGKCKPQKLVEQEARLKVGARGRELNPADTVAQVQLLGMFRGNIEQTMQAPAQVGRLANIRL